MIKWLLVLSVIGPLIAIFSGSAGNRSALAEAPVTPNEKVKQIYILEHYKMAEPYMVVTVNHFPFDIGGLRPYEINIQGQKFVFDQKDVQEFLTKGRPMNVDFRPLPTGMVFIDGFGQPIDKSGSPSEDRSDTVLHRPNTKYPVVNISSRLR
jgi:hypothetical protein